MNKKTENSKPMIDPADDFFGAILNCAVRYSMGRNSYMPSLVTDFIKPLLPYISRKTLYVFKQDYEADKQNAREDKFPLFGDVTVQGDLWNEFYANVCDELNKRDKGD